MRMRLLREIEHLTLQLVQLITKLKTRRRLEIYSTTPAHHMDPVDPENPRTLGGKRLVEETGTR